MSESAESRTILTGAGNVARLRTVFDSDLMVNRSVQDV
jgi:hypothetical protein